MRKEAWMVLPLAPSRCGPVGGSVEACGKMDSDTPELGWYDA
jgi:hypothetical protein